MSKPKIYIVTAGEYSNYQIHGVFSTYQKALDYAKLLGETGRATCADVEDWWVLDEHAECKPVARYGTVLLTPTGDLFKRSVDMTLSTHPLENYSNSMRCAGYSLLSAEHADKVAAEVRQAYLRKQTEVGQ